MKNKWIKIKDEVPEIGSVVKIKMVSGELHDCCEFMTYKYYADDCEKLGIKIDNEALEERIKLEGEYMITSWEGNDCALIDFNKIDEWKYIHRAVFDGN